MSTFRIEPPHGICSFLREARQERRHWPAPWNATDSRARARSGASHPGLSASLSAIRSRETGSFGSEVRGPVSFFGGRGPRTRRLARFLERRSRTTPARRPTPTASHHHALRKRAVVFTDTADFTLRTLGTASSIPELSTAWWPPPGRAGAVGGEIVKVEGDSLLVRFDDATAACRGVDALEECLRRLNRGRPENEQLAFSYGIGYGDVLDLEQDLFGLEVNLASKLGEDLAQPGEALLTPAAAASLDPATMPACPPSSVDLPRARHPGPTSKLRSRRPIRASLTTLHGLFTRFAS